MTPPRLLLADDQPHVVEALRLLLKPEGYHIDTADSPDGILAAIATHEYAAVLMDLNYARDTTSGQEGLALLVTIRQRDTTTPVIVMTAWGTVGLAVDAMRLGAKDFIEKPWDNARVLAIVRTQTALGRALKDAAALEVQRHRDLALASQIQQRLFPHVLPPMASLDYCGMCRPAREVGGDYYDFLSLDATHLGLAVGDVSGKGVSAALLMAGLQALVRSRAPVHHVDAAGLVNDLNQLLRESSPSDKYATLFYGIYDDQARSLTYVNAGHNPPFLIQGAAHRTPAVRRLEGGGCIIGMFEDISYTQHTIALAPGDTLVIFSDGFPEARNADDEELGDERLLVAASRTFDSAAACRDHLADVAAAFVADAARYDDMTLVVARVR